MVTVSQITPIPISDLTSASTLTGNEATAIVQGGATVQASVSQLPQGMTAGVVVYGNTGGSPFPNFRTLKAGSNITIDDAGSQGDLTISANGTTTITSVSGTANRITSTGGTTPIIDISSSYVGQTSITTLGTVATGTWSSSVSGATINNSPIGGTSPSTGTFTTIAANRFIPNGSTVPSNGLYLPAGNLPAISARSAISMAFSNPASAVNYLQSTGATVGNGPTIEATGNDSNIPIYIYAAGSANVNIGADANQGTVIGSQVLATNATKGFLWIPSCAGTPSASPAIPYSGAVGITFDSTNRKIYAFSAGTWYSTSALT